MNVTVGGASAPAARFTPDNDATQSATAAAAAQAGSEAARPSDPALRSEAGWSLANKNNLPSGAGFDARAEADAGGNAKTAMQRTDLPPAEAKRLQTVVEHLGNALLDGRIDPHVNDTFRQHLRHVATERHDSPEFRGAMAQLNRAAEVLDRVELASGTKLTYDPGDRQSTVAKSGLPILNVAHIDADLYFKTQQGELHIESVKATPGTLTGTLQTAEQADQSQSSQVERQAKWEKGEAPEAGKPPQDPRKVRLYTMETGPGFQHLLNTENLGKLEKFAGHDPDSRRFVIGDRAYSLNDFKHMSANAAEQGQAHVENLREQHLAGADASKRFDARKEFNNFYGKNASSPEDLMRLTGKSYGQPQPKLSPLDPTNMPSPRQGALFGGVAAAGITMLRLGADGKLNLSEAVTVGKQAVVGATAGGLAAAGERVVTPLVDRAVGAGVQRAVTAAASSGTGSKIASAVTAQSGEALGVGARTLIARAGGATLVGTAIATGVSVYENREGLAHGDSKAVGNVTADAAVAAGSVLSSVAAGAAIGTMIPVPVVGTVVGAVGGLAVGVGVAYAAQISGARDAVAGAVSGAIDDVKSWF